MPRPVSSGPPTTPGGGPTRSHQPVTAGPPTTVQRRTKPATPPLPDWWALLHGNSDPNGLGVVPVAPISRAVLATDLLPFCYGQVRVSCPAIAYGATNPGESTWQRGQALIAWCEGPIQSIDAVMCNGNVIRAAFANDGYQTFNRLDFTGVPGELNSYIGGFYDKTLGRLAVANRVAGSFMEDIITANYPYGGVGWWGVMGGTETGTALEFAADVHGLLLYDPRLDSTVTGGSGPQREADPSTWTYSNCPPLIWRDLWRRVGNLNYTTIDDASVITAANAADAAGFTCNIAFVTKITLEQALAAVLQTCNGVTIDSNGKKGIFVDVPNASPAVASFSEADGDVWGLKYQWLSARDRYTQCVVAFQNRDAAYKSDQTSIFGDPGTFSSEPTVAIASVTVGTGTLHMASSPGWSINDTVLFFQNGGAAIGGLNDGQLYYVKTISGADVTLSAVASGPLNALTGSPVITTQYLQRVGTLYPPTEVVKLLTINAPGVNTMAAAVILRDYVFNSQAITFRITGSFNTKGILLQQGMKVTLTTLKLAAGDYLLQQIAGDAAGFFSFVLKPYTASVYGSTPITVQPPIVITPPNPQDPPADITVTDATGTVKVAGTATSNQQIFNLYQLIKYTAPSGVSSGAVSALVVRGFSGTGAHTKTWADMVASERQIPVAGNQPPPDATHSALIFDPVIETVRTLTFDQSGQLDTTVDVTLDSRIIIRTVTSAGTLSAGVTVDVSASTNTVTNPRTDVPRFNWEKPSSGAINGTNKVFVIPHNWVTGTLLVVADGQVMVDASFSPVQGGDYSVSGNNVTFVNAPNSWVGFLYQRSVN